MNDFLYALISGETATLTWSGVLETLIASIIIGLVISLLYLFTHREEGYSQAFYVALILLAPIVGMVILVIGNNVATAFSLAGAFALVRFRSAPGDPKDIAYVFMSVTNGSYLRSRLLDMGGYGCCDTRHCNFDFAFHKLCRQKGREICP
ncbi:MAG: DUF4956 domain-containing protein [Clostridiales bacterium]|nr:DUF4956 domain-containing protein [Clostridiales bacterium]